MTVTWTGASEPRHPRPGPAGVARAVARGTLLFVLLAGGLAAKGLVRLVERPACHPRRPVSPWITVAVCRGALRLMRLRVERRGEPMGQAGAMVANHSSWLDILVLNAQAPVVFVAKSEVSRWPGIGLLARATGTLFVRREARSQAAAQAGEVAQRLCEGATLLIFPEGTSTDGRRVLPFKSSLFAGLTAPGLSVQPVSLTWTAPEGRDPSFHAWWGGMSLGPHALAVLSARKAGHVSVTFHPPIAAGGRDRKALAAEAEAAVRFGVQPIADDSAASLPEGSG